MEVIIALRMDLTPQHEVKCTNLAQYIFGAKFCQIVKNDLQL